MTLWMWCAVAAWAERPITYGEALRTSMRQNIAVARATAAKDQAEGSLRAARGQYDPFYALDGNWRTSRNQGFFQGFPFESESRSWGLTNSLNGTAPSGTSYGLNLSLDRNFSEFTTDILGNSQTQLQDAFTGNLNASVTQQLLRGLRFKYNAQNVISAKTGLKLADLDVEKQRQEALYAAAEAYWNWAYQYELHQIALGSVRVAEEALRVGALQVESGQLAPVEATRLKAAVVQAQQNALDTGNLSEQFANVVLLAMGENPGDAVRPTTQPGDVPDLMDLDADKAVSVALAQNIDLEVASRSLDQAKVDLANARHGLLPSLTATVAAGVASQRCPPETARDDCPEGSVLSTIGGLTAADNQPLLSLQGRFEVPIGNRAARGQRDRDRATVWQRELELEAQERQIGAQVEEQVRALQSARQRMELADANQRLAEETLTAEEALASAGRTLQKDVLEARTEVDRTRAEAAKARTDYRLAQALLLKLQGQLTEATP